MSWLDSLLDVVGRLLSGPQSTSVHGPIHSEGTGLKQAWRSWQEMTYDRDTARSETASGVNLSDLDRRIAALFQQYFEEGGLDPAAADDLMRCQTTLAQVVPSLSGNSRQYFAMASSIARGIVEEMNDSSARPTHAG